jgi:hypothetical protein
MESQVCFKEQEAIESVFAFKKGSIDTSFMAGEQLPPLNTFKPTIKNLFFSFFLPIHSHSKNTVANTRS